MRDKLSRDERIRLECLSLAINVSSISTPTINRIVENAIQLETFIKEGKTK